MLTFPTHPHTTSRPLSLIMMLVVASSIVIARPLSHVPPLPSPAPAAPTAAGNYLHQSLSFVPNAGQSDPAVRMQVQALGGTLFFTPGEVVLSLPTPQPNPARQPVPTVDDVRQTDPASMTSEVQPSRSPTVVRVRWDGANPTPQIAGTTPLPGVVNYFRGHDPAQWRTNVPTYAGVAYSTLYPGINFRFDGQNGALKGTYHVAPGANPAHIRWRYEGASHPTLDATGALVLRLGAATLTDLPPVAWQEIAGQRRDVAIHYVVHADSSVGFVLGSYDPAYALTLDPELTYSTYGSKSLPVDVAADRAGNAYLVGITTSTAFPVKNAVQPICAGPTTYGCDGDVFVTKFGPDGTVLYSTYWGGQRGEEDDVRVAVDATGNAFVAGTTVSADFPTKNALQPSCQPNPGDGGSCRMGKAFLTKFTPKGAIAFSTFWGGSGNDRSQGVAVDTAGNVMITGTTSSTDFPLKNAMQPSMSPCGADVCSNAFVTRFTSSGAVVYSTYLGGTSGVDRGYDIATDRVGNAYITGSTGSADFPTRNAYQPTCEQFEPEMVHCDTNAFVTKLTPAGALAYSTYLGGPDHEWGTGIAADAAGNVHVMGRVDGGNFPMTNRTNCEQAPCHGTFVAGLDPTGELVYATVFSGHTLRTRTAEVVSFMVGQWRLMPKAMRL